MLALIPSGKLIDRFGTGPFLNAGFLLAAFSLSFFDRAFSAAGFPVRMHRRHQLRDDPARMEHLRVAFGSERERGAVWGFFLTLQGSGMVVGPVVSGQLWDRIGHSSPFLASAVVMALLFVIHLVLSRRMKAGAQLS